MLKYYLIRSKEMMLYIHNNNRNMPRLFDEPREAHVYMIDKILDPNDKPDVNFYIGSTLTSVEKRMGTHKYYCDGGMNRKVYKYIRENGGWESFKYEIYETRIVNSLEEQLKFEQEFIDILNPPLNQVKSHQTEEQRKASKKKYALENKEHLKLKSRERYIKNFDDISAKQKIYAVKNKEHIAEYNKKWVEKNKVGLTAYKKNWYEKNKHKNKEADKIKYQKNKSAILAKSKVRVNCECGMQVARGALLSHKRKSNHTKMLKMTSQQKKEWFADRITCECGVLVRKRGIPLHKRSKGHLKHIADV